MPRSPSENLTAVTAAYDSEYENDTILAIDVLGPGTLIVKDIEGTTVTYPFTAFVAAGGAYSVFPYRVCLRVREILGDGSGAIGNGVTGTDITLANLVVLH